MKSYRDLVAEAKQTVPEISVEELQARLDQPSAPVLIDVRDPDEYREGFIDGAENISRGFLEFKIQDAYPDPQTPLVLYCLSGLRSLLAAKALHDLGYRQVSSMAGRQALLGQLGVSTAHRAWGAIPLPGHLPNRGQLVTGLKFARSDAPAQGFSYLLVEE